jgi:predicted Zn-dependent peptidase
VADLLGGGATARLDRHLREELGLVYEARARLVREPGHALLRVSTRLDGRDPGPGLAALSTELRGLVAIDLEELQRARATRLFSVARAQDGIEGVSALLGELALLGLDPTARQAELDDLARIAVPELVEAARVLLHPDTATWVVMGDGDVLAPALRELDFAPIQQQPAGCLPQVE